MATIIAKNQTGGDLALKSISAVNAKIPASGEANLTDFNAVWKIQAATELITYITNDQVLLNLDGTDLTKQQSLDVLQGGSDPKAVHVDTAGEFSGVTEKTSLADADIFLIEDSAASGAKKKVQVTNLPGGSVFGTEWQYAEDLTVSSTTSNTFIQKLRLTTSDLPSGNYLLTWDFSWNLSTKNDPFGAQIQLNDTTVLANLQSHAIDSDSVERYPAGGHVILTSFSGVNTFDMDFRAVISGTAYIRDARLLLWRVS